MENVEPEHTEKPKARLSRLEADNAALRAALDRIDAKGLTDDDLVLAASYIEGILPNLWGDQKEEATALARRLRAVGYAVEARRP